jgi:protein TonB
VTTPPPPTKKPPKAPPPTAPAPAPTVEAVVPKEMPKELPKEGPAVESRTPKGAVLGHGNSSQGTGTAPEAPPPAPPPPPPPPPKVKEPVNLPEDGTPAEPNDDNVAPEPPVEMIEKGIAGKVILKIVISETGKVTKLDVMKGEEPFVSAAVAAVKTWTYKPATVDGAPIAVFKIVKIDFAPK